jgi:hypothetical protein
MHDINRMYSITLNVLFSVFALRVALCVKISQATNIKDRNALVLPMFDGNRARESFSKEI